MREQTCTLVAAGGDELYRCSWLPDEEPAAALAVVHGYGEHGGRYRCLVDAMVPLGYAVHVFDLRGHGRSPGGRGHIERFADYVDDTAVFVDAVAAEQAGRAALPARPQPRRADRDGLRRGAPGRSGRPRSSRRRSCASGCR